MERGAESTVSGKADIMSSKLAERKASFEEKLEEETWGESIYKFDEVLIHSRTLYLDEASQSIYILKELQYPITN